MTRFLLAVSAAISLLSAAALAQAPVFRPAPTPPVVTPGYSPGTPPNPAYTPPGTGLPEVGQPGGGVESVPRSPNKRILPVTNEPGLWAADGAPVAIKGRPMIFGVELPFGKASEADRTIAAECSSALTAVVSRRPVVENYLAKEPENIRRCLASKAFLHCAKRMSQELQAGRITHPTFGPDAVSPSAERAAVLERRYCDGVELNPAHENVLASVLRQWESEELGPRIKTPREDP